MSDLVTFISTACRPAQLYLFLVLVNIVFAFIGKFKADSKMFKIFIAMFVFTILIGLGFTWLANYLCIQGLAPIAWLLVLLPLSTLLVNLLKLIKD
jgi:hypothetical protein